MEIVVIVLATIIAVAAWSVFWAVRLWRKWRALWAALTDFFGVLDELLGLLDSAGAEAGAALVPRGGSAVVGA